MLRGHPVSPAAASWLVTVLATTLASAVRLSGLSRVPQLLFDETYYVKDAWSLWVLGYEGTWDAGSDAAFSAGDPGGLSSAAAFVVHPPLGKWLIGAGMQLFGQSDPFGWRVASALAGIVGVLLVSRLAWNLSHSLAVTALSGLFLATDGMHIVMSRVGMLDIFLSTFVLAAFLAVAKDQESPRAGVWNRPWLAAAGLMLGLACATKWSGIYAVAALGVFVLGSEVVRAASPPAGEPEPDTWTLCRGLLEQAGTTFVYLVAGAGLTYIVAWAGWLGRSGAHGDLPGLWAYHQEIWDFHTALSAEHAYQSSPGGWLAQIRPTSLWFADPVSGCGSEHCVATILALGNPLLWWSAAAALLAMVWLAFTRKGFGPALVLTGFVAMYLPWFLYPNRTMFTFYSVAFAPFVAIAVGWAIVTLAGTPSRSPSARAVARCVVATLWVGAIVGSAIYFAPLWTGYPLEFDAWWGRMWFDSWV